MSAVEAAIIRMDGRFDRLDAQFEKAERRFDKLDDGQMALRENLAELKGRVSQLPTFTQIMGLLIGLIALVGATLGTAGIYRHFFGL